MSAWQATYDLMVADSPVSTSLGTRIFFVEAPQKTTLPYCVMNTDMQDTTFTKSGASKLDTWRVEIDIYHTSLTLAQTVADQVISVLDGYTGTINSVLVQRIHLDSQEADKDIDNDRIWSLDFIMRKGR